MRLLKQNKKNSKEWYKKNGYNDRRFGFSFAKSPKKDFNLGFQILKVA
jgi:hypothetical protein